MPTYDYVCRSCKHAFEEFQSISAKVLKKCPECGKNSLQRLIGSGSGVIFKGSGFYETDYKKSSAGSAPAKSEDSKPAKDSTESKKDTPKKKKD